MDAKQWARYSALLDHIFELPTGDRAAWLDKLRAEDAATADELEILLRSAIGKGADALTAPDASQTYLRWYADAARNADARQSGQQFGPWRLQRQLGEGGMGEVWLAERTDGLYQGEAALKFIRAGLAPEYFAARFARERAVLARLNHPGIARLLDAGVTGGLPWLVLEYVEGMPLLAYAEAQRLTVAARVQLLVAAAEAVEYAHGRLVVHRDLKPSNLLVTPQGQVKLLDFGIAGLLDGGDGDGDHHLTRLTGSPLTPGYAAPEQITGETSSVAADVFALGVLLFQLLAGARPFAPGQTARAAIEHAVLHQQPLSLRRALNDSDGSHPPDVQNATGLAPILDKALQKMPEDRYASVAALVDDLQRWLEHRPLKAAPAPWPTRTRLWLRRNRLLASAATIVFLVTFAGLVSVSLQARKAERQRLLAVSESTRARAVTDYLLHMFRTVQEENSAAAEPITAETLLSESAKRVRSAFADNPAAARETLFAIGELYFTMRDDLAAESVFREYLTLLDTDAEPEQTATVRSYLATLVFNKGDAAQARAFFDQAQVFWNTDPVRWRESLLADSQFEARMLRTAGAFAEAVLVTQRALRMRIEASGETHPETAGARGALAQALCEAGRTEEGLEQFRLVSEVHQRLGEPAGVDAIANLGIWGDEARKAGKLDDAERLLTRALEADRQQFGPSMGRAIKLRSMGNLRLAQSRPDEALSVFAEGIALAKTYAGEKSPLLFQLELARLRALRVAGNLDLARSGATDLVQRAEALRGNEDAYLGLALIEQARLAQTSGAATTAEADLNRAERILKPFGARWRVDLNEISKLRIGPIR